MALDDPLDQKSLKSAHGALEHSSFIMELANWIGKPVEFVIKSLPDAAGKSVESVTSAALRVALKLALSSMDLNDRAAASPRWHRAMVTLSGGVGGAMGWPGLAIELPLSTTIMLRSIADIARAEGENLQNPEARLACIEVFALGGRLNSDDAAESGYFTVRAALAKAVTEAATYVIEKGAAEEAAPVLVRLVDQIAQRFSPAVADKAIAQAAPAIGAVGGATVNLLFINHFQEIARGHFTIRRLERKYGPDRIRLEYDQLRKARA
jgi:hypothetical protein